MNALERLERANPVPDEDRLLATPDAIDAFVLSVREKSGLEPESGDAVLRSPERERGLSPEDAGEPVSSRLRRPTGRSWVFAAAAAALTVLIVGAVLVVDRMREDSSALPPAGSGPVTVVASAYEALNSGDIDAWLDHFRDDALVFGRPKDRLGVVFRVLAAVDYRTDVVEPCRLGEPGSGSGTTVECVIEETDAFHAAGGLSVTKREVFTVDSAGRISGAEAAVLSLTHPGNYVFNQAFFDWLRVSYPDVHAEIRPPLTTHLPENPDHMRTAMDYLDEFIAQSERYPVGG